MEVTNELIEKLAHLSRLSFDSREKERIRQDLEKMIGFVDKINELNLGDVTPMVHLPGETNIFREDEVKDVISREDALKNAASHDGVFFKVPKAIKK